MSMTKLKVMVVLGTRPEIIRLSRVISALDKHTELVLVHTGQNYDYELNEVFFEQLGVKRPNYFLDAVGVSSVETIGNVITKIGILLSEVLPDCMLVLGDTNSCLCVIPAKKAKVPVFHMEAGNRCFDQRVPEEINRRIVDHTSDINMPYSDIAREYLLAEGLPADQIIKTGSPMYEVLHHYYERISESDILDQLGLESDSYFLVSAHREENVDSNVNIDKLGILLNYLVDAYGVPVIVSTHPRTRARIQERGLRFPAEVHLLKPMGFIEYNKLQVESKCTLSDSGTISEEASILNFPALNIREAHERPEAMEEASVMMVGLEVARIKQALGVLESQNRGNQRTVKLVRDYGSSNVSEKVVRIVHSYTDYVNRVVWKKVE